MQGFRLHKRFAQGSNSGVVGRLVKVFTSEPLLHYNLPLEYNMLLVCYDTINYPITYIHLPCPRPITRKDKLHMPRNAR